MSTMFSLEYNNTPHTTHARLVTPCTTHARQLWELITPHLNNISSSTAHWPYSQNCTIRTPVERAHVTSGNTKFWPFNELCSMYFSTAIKYLSTKNMCSCRWFFVYSWESDYYLLKWCWKSAKKELLKVVCILCKLEAGSRLYNTAAAT